MYIIGFGRWVIGLLGAIASIIIIGIILAVAIMVCILDWLWGDIG
jgi:hypothetical protein